MFPIDLIALQGKWVGVHNSVWGIRCYYYFLHPPRLVYAPMQISGTHINRIEKQTNFIKNIGFFD